jgi:hypothetical protein
MPVSAYTGEINMLKNILKAVINNNENEIVFLMDFIIFLRLKLRMP